MRSLALRLLPYFIAIAIGVTMYAAADWYIQNESIRNMLMSAASGLLGIPLVFISYEVVKEFCDGKLHRELSEHLYFELNNAVIVILAALRRLTDFGEITEENIGAFAKIPNRSLLRHIKPDPSLAEEFLKGKTLINAVVHGDSHISVLANEDVQTILEIARQAGILSTELSHFTDKDGADSLANSLALLLDMIDKWLETQGGDLTQHHSFQFVNHEPKSLQSREENIFTNTVEKRDEMA